MQDNTFRGDRQSWQPWFDLHPPSYEQLTAVITAIDEVLTREGFEQGPFGFDPISEDAPLYMRASWVREPLTDRHDLYLTDGGIVGSVDNASVWGSGLIRLDVDKQAIELTFRGTAPHTLAAIVAAHVQAADAPYH
ncbi:hypothetical protein [Nocardia sp. CNY236]|uniref:hypothetical protein n=1 Tax=Nocardia sp. CNY236 TaxID=1169152 RepID=UPI0012DC515D|nr:hypothetical protein [Nocardia sp. CNY236]